MCKIKYDDANDELKIEFSEKDNHDFIMFDFEGNVTDIRIPNFMLKLED